MVCDQCGKETGITESPNVYGFVFCNPMDIPYDREACQDTFERKLWEAAQADKEAKQKAAREAQEPSFNPLEMVDGYPF